MCRVASLSMHGTVVLSLAHLGLCPAFGASRMPGGLSSHTMCSPEGSQTRRLLLQKGVRELSFSTLEERAEIKL